MNGCICECSQPVSEQVKLQLPHTESGCLREAADRGKTTARPHCLVVLVICGASSYRESVKLRLIKLDLLQSRPAKPCTKRSAGRTSCSGPQSPSSSFHSSTGISTPRPSYCISSTFNTCSRHSLLPVFDVLSRTMLV